MSKHPVIRKYPCGVLIYDRKATAADGRVRFRTCGADHVYIITFNRDQMFPACARHNRRLDKAGVMVA